MQQAISRIGFLGVRVSPVSVTVYKVLGCKTLSLIKIRKQDTSGAGLVSGVVGVNFINMLIRILLVFMIFY